MINAFTMKIVPGQETEYKKRHDAIWPELTKALREAGIREYYIFLDEGSRTLFAFQHLDDHARLGSLTGLPIMRKWWDYMADIMEVNPDLSPKVKPLTTMFTMK